MKMHINVLLILIAILGLQGCLSSNTNYYILSHAPTPTSVYAQKNGAIGVDKVKVPAYMYKREIAVAKSNSQITLLGTAKWGEDLDTGLTERLIGYLQKKFNQADVYAYPWGVEKQPVVKVKVDVTRFIAFGDKVYLDASWEVTNLKNKKRKAKLFSTAVSTKADPGSIVSSMNEAFSQLEKQLAIDIRLYE